MTRIRRTGWLAAIAIVLVTTSGCLASWHPVAASSDRPVRPLRLPARAAASLPPDGAYAVGSRVLVGHRRYVDNIPAGRPVLWTTDAVLPDAGAVWARLAKRYATTGLYPVLLSAADEDTSGYPWLDGAFDRDTTGPVSTDPARVMGELYAEYRDGVETDHPPLRLPPLRTTWRSGPDLGAGIEVSAEAARPIALELLAFCPDVPYEAGLDQTARDLVDNPAWSCWWD